MTSPTFSIVTTCKGRLEFLKRSLPTFVQQPETEVVVVDYDCPNGTKDWIAAHFPGVHVATVISEPFFNASRARNIGARLARAPWLVFCDADQLVAPSFAAELSGRMVPGAYLRTLRETPWGLRSRQFPLACEASKFWSIGGYDDAFRGWGPEDREFVERLDRSGAREVLCPATLVETLQHSEAERSSHFEHTINVSAVINFCYARIKKRYFETAGRWLTNEQRYSTHSQVEKAVLASLAEPESDAIFEIEIVASAPTWTARLTAKDIRHFHEIRIETRARAIP